MLFIIITWTAPNTNWVGGLLYGLLVSCPFCCQPSYRPDPFILWYKSNIQCSTFLKYIPKKNFLNVALFFIVLDMKFPQNCIQISKHFDSFLSFVKRDDFIMRPQLLMALIASDYFIWWKWVDSYVIKYNRF